MKLHHLGKTILCVSLFLFSCTQEKANGIIDPTAESPAAPALSVSKPDWFAVELTDVQTGNKFSINDYGGKVVLLETMAIWCPNCIVQATQISKLREALGHPQDLIPVSLDVDPNEDNSMLKVYASDYHFNWLFAVAPLEIGRALGNLYSAEYLNPPLSPMLIIDRVGNVHQLKYGVKDAATLQKLIEPYLTK
jgi:cytochrome oxidase Cu insertion factor (SCO1/SenC/PrrC family)